MIDLALFQLLNQALAHPVLDILMIGLSTVGLALLPAAGAVLLFNPRQRRLGVTILLTLAAALIATLIVQYLALRPRPEAFRPVINTPNFPSFPSGHAAAAFAFAAVVGLKYRRWLGWALLLAALIGLSRIYLGVHYPSDIFAGAVLGSAVGAAAYGLAKPHPEWRWLLWPQIAVAIIVSQMAYMGLLPFYLLMWPLADKVFHFLLFGAVVFWLNLWMDGRSVKMVGLTLPLAILIPLSLALLEEGVQSFSPLRSADIFDLTSDLGGMLFFWLLSFKLRLAQDKPTIPKFTSY